MATTVHNGPCGTASRDTSADPRETTDSASSTDRRNGCPTHSAPNAHTRAKPPAISPCTILPP